MVPPGERLDGGEHRPLTRGGEADDRLVVHLQPVLLDRRRRSWASSTRSRARALACSSNSAQRSLPAALAWYIATSASRRTSSASTWVGPATTTPRLPDTVIVVAPSADRAGDRLEHPAGHVAGIGLVPQAPAQHGELVTAEARHDVTLAHGLAQPPRHLDEQGVAGLVAELVVDLLEVVEVEEQQAGRVGRRRRGC